MSRTSLAASHAPQNAFCWDSATRVPLEALVHACMVRRGEAMQLTSRRRSLTDDVVSKFRVKDSGSLTDDSGTGGRILQQLVSAARRNRLFHYHSSTQITEVLKNCVAVRVPAGRLFFEADKFDSNFAIVMEGRLIVSHKGSKVAEVNPLQSVGELELLFDCPRLYDVRPHCTTLMYVLPGSVCGEVVQFVRKKLLSVMMSHVMLTNRLEHKHAQAALSAGLFFWVEQGEVVLQPSQPSNVVAILLEGVVHRDTGELEEQLVQGHHFGSPYTPNKPVSSAAVPQRRATYSVGSPGGALVLLVPWALYAKMHHEWRGELSKGELTPEAFASVPHLNALSEPNLVRVCEACSTATLQPGEKLPAEAATAVVAVVRGTLVQHDDGGKAMAEVGPGQLAAGADTLQRLRSAGTPCSSASAGQLQAAPDSSATVLLLQESALKKLELYPPPPVVSPGVSPLNSPLASPVSSPTGETRFSNSSLSTGDFKVLGMLGTGANGKVQLVRYSPGNGQDCIQLNKNTLYALKSYNKQALRVSVSSRRETVPAVVQNEKEMMMLCDSPLIVRIEASFVDKTDYHMLLEFVRAGDLFSLLDRHDHLPAKTASFYMVCIALGMDHLHQRLIVYRDMKPENVMIAADGYAKIADLGLAKKLKHATAKTFTVCGTPEYMAPELVTRQGHSFGVDFWALGILLFEMLTGMPPFYHDKNPMLIYQQITNADIKWPSSVSSTSKSLMEALLRRNTRLRLNSWATTLEHEWFSALDVPGVLAGTVSPPWIPNLRNELDIHYFEDAKLK